MINAVQKSFAIVTLLAGQEMRGVRNQELAQSTGLSPASITEHLRTLQELGIAEEIPALPGRWRLGPKLIQYAMAYERHIASVQHDLDEVRQRRSRLPHN